MGLTENDVVEAVGAHLRKKGYSTPQELSTLERGIDIVGINEHTKRKILVEAKGGTSSKQKTNRYGKSFTPNQKKSHVSVALYWAAQTYERANAEGAEIALAFPDDAKHRELVMNIEKALSALSVAVYFVAEDLTVTTMKESAFTEPDAAADPTPFRRAGH